MLNRMNRVFVLLVAFLIYAECMAAELVSCPIQHDYDKVIGEVHYEEWVSPDGCQICYGVPGYEGYGMKVLLADTGTGRKTVILESPRWIEIEWSPDSHYIAAINHWDGHAANVTVYHLNKDEDGITTRTLADTEGAYGEHWGVVAWNLSAKTAILSKSVENDNDKNDDETYSCHTLNLENGTLSPVAFDSVYSINQKAARDACLGKWLSPNGKYICCYKYLEDIIYLSDHDSQTTCSLMTSKNGNYRVDWSPDSRFIALSDAQKIGGSEDLNASSLTIYRIIRDQGKIVTKIVYQPPIVTGTMWKVANWDDDCHAVVQLKTAANPVGPSGYDNQYALIYREVLFDRHDSGN